MTELTQALNAIYTYLEREYPDIAAKLPAGLSYEKTREKLQNLPYKLPQEVYELYRFCGGWDWEAENWDTIFASWYGTMTLRSPTTILEDVKHFETHKIKYIGKPVVPILGFDRSYLCVVGDFPEEYSSPVVHVCELNHVELHYVNLTSMMQVTAASWQAGAVYIDKEGFVECDEKRFFAIYCQCNSELPLMVLSRLRKELELARADDDKLYKAWNSLYENVCWLTKCWTELSIDRFQPELIEPIVKEANKEDKTINSRYAQLILAELTRHR